MFKLMLTDLQFIYQSHHQNLDIILNTSKVQSFLQRFCFKKSIQRVKNSFDYGFKIYIKKEIEPFKSTDFKVDMIDLLALFSNSLNV